ncbi:Rav2 protein [Martiniozyma asiatica (nom. inval.)]|nr:Rav2 protein [Martiniozyma asiatica]
MTTEIYNTKALTNEEIEAKIKINEKKELDWLMFDIIRPQLPQIRDNLAICLSRIDESDETAYKLPLSSHNSEVLKGTLTRKNFKITGLNLQVKTNSFNSGHHMNFKLKKGKFIIIRQLLDCHDSMENAVNYLDKIIENEHIDSMLFVKYVQQVLKDIKLAKKSLNNSNSAYTFPKYRILPDIITPLLPNTSALDITINSSELRLDFFVLNKVTTKPWDTILDSDKRISFADSVRDKISTDRNKPINKIITTEYLKLLEWYKEHPELTKPDATGLHSIMSIFSSNNNPSLSTMVKTAGQFLEKTVTYVDENGEPYVVTVEETHAVITADPVLLSVSVKLDSLEKAISRMMENLCELA